MSRPVICGICGEKITDRENASAKHVAFLIEDEILGIETMNGEFDICEDCIKRINALDMKEEQ